jgi:hypothetical protein
VHQDGFAFEEEGGNRVLFESLARNELRAFFVTKAAINGQCESGYIHAAGTGLYFGVLCNSSREMTDVHSFLSARANPAGGGLSVANQPFFTLIVPVLACIPGGVFVYVQRVNQVFLVPRINAV